MCGHVFSKLKYNVNIPKATATNAEHNTSLNMILSSCSS